MDEEVIPSLDDLLNELDREEEEDAGCEAVEATFTHCTARPLSVNPHESPVNQKHVELGDAEAKRIAEIEHRAFEARLRRAETRAAEERRRRAREAAAEARERARMAAEEAPERERLARRAAARREEETRRQLEKQLAKRRLLRAQEEAAARRRREQREEERRRRAAERLRARLDRLARQGYALGAEGWACANPWSGEKGAPAQGSATPSEATAEEEEEEEEVEEAAAEAEPDGGALEVVEQRAPREREDAAVRPLEEMLAELDRGDRECWAASEGVPALEELLEVIRKDGEREEEEREAREVKQEFSDLGRVEADEDEACQSSEIRIAKQMRPDFDWNGALKAEKTLKYYNYDFDESKQEGANSFEERQARAAAISAKLEKARNRLSLVRWKAGAAESSKSSAKGWQAQLPGAGGAPAAALPRRAQDAGQFEIAGWPWAPAQAEPARVSLKPNGSLPGFKQRNGPRELVEVD